MSTVAAAGLRVALLGFPASVAAALWEALAEVGYEAVVVPPDSLAVQAVVRAAVDVLVLDGRAYLNTRAILDDLRATPAARSLPVVVLGPVVVFGSTPSPPAASGDTLGGTPADRRGETVTAPWIASGGVPDPSFDLRQVLGAIERVRAALPDGG